MVKNAAKIKGYPRGEALFGAKAPYMTEIEKGRENLSLKKIIEIAEYLDADVFDLFLDPGLSVIGRRNK